MSEKTELWDELGRTDPAHTKTFKRAGGFSGTAIKPMWSYRRMTEQFGPCGEGWGVGEPTFQVVPGAEGEVLVYCTASIWYTYAPGERQRTVFGVGGDKVVVKNKYGLTGDDEAFKKAYTDAVTNALKLIGVGADVHMGLFDDSKYINSMKEEFGDGKDKPADASKNDDARNLYSTLESAMRLATTKAELRSWWSNPTNVSARNRLPSSWQGNLREESIKLAESLPEGHEEKAA